MSQEAELLSNSVKAKMLQMPNYVILVCKLYLMIPKFMGGFGTSCEKNLKLHWAIDRCLLEDFFIKRVKNIKRSGYFYKRKSWKAWKMLSRVETIKWSR